MLLNQLYPLGVERVADVEIEFTKSQLTAGIPGMLFCIWYVMKKHWLANNTLGLAFSIQVTLVFLSLSIAGVEILHNFFSSMGYTRDTVSLMFTKLEECFDHPFIGYKSCDTSQFIWLYEGGECK
jgi:uncharacterized membrane protein YccF (DUF307 family)